jgi:hypothetical protein
VTSPEDRQKAIDAMITVLRTSNPDIPEEDVRLAATNVVDAAIKKRGG